MHSNMEESKKWN